MKLTPAQKSLLCSELITGHGEPFIWLATSSQDRVAANLSGKGLGCFVNNKGRYSWRSRDGYGNSFIPNEEGMKLRAELKAC